MNKVGNVNKELNTKEIKLIYQKYIQGQKLIKQESIPKNN